MRISLYVSKDSVHTLTLPRSIAVWILKNITSPIRGFDQKKNSKGEYVTLKEKLSETQYQVLLIAPDYYQKGYPRKKIIQILSHFINKRQKEEQLPVGLA